MEALFDEYKGDMRVLGFTVGISKDMVRSFPMSHNFLINDGHPFLRILLREIGNMSIRPAVVRLDIIRNRGWFCKGFKRQLESPFDLSISASLGLVNGFFRRKNN